MVEDISIFFLPQVSDSHLQISNSFYVMIGIYIHIKKEVSLPHPVFMDIPVYRKLG
jgi:hypothetical protein